MARHPLLRSSILVPPAVAATALAIAAAHLHPPAGSTARLCLAIAGGLLLVDLIAWVARDGAGFGREERLWAFVVFAAVAIGYSLAREAIAEREFDAIVEVQQHELMESAANLSREILAYVDGRIRAAPPRPQDASTWEQDVAEWAAFERDTAAGYRQRFALRVRTTRSALTFRNLRDRDLDALYQQPANASQIRIIGERLGVLADRLHRALTPAD